MPFGPILELWPGCPEKGWRGFTLPFNGGAPQGSGNFRFPAAGGGWFTQIQVWMRTPRVFSEGVVRYWWIRTPNLCEAFNGADVPGNWEGGWEPPVCSAPAFCVWWCCVCWVADALPAPGRAWSRSPGRRFDGRDGVGVLPVPLAATPPSWDRIYTLKFKHSPSSALLSDVFSLLQTHKHPPRSTQLIPFLQHQL